MVVLLHVSSQTLPADNRENNVQMVDEYDQIHRDLFLFRAYTPATLRKRIESLRDMPGTFSVAVDDGVVTASTRDDSLRGTRGVSERMDAQVEFLAPISKHLGNILAVFNAHDYPRSLMAFSHSSELIDRIEDGDCECSIGSVAEPRLGRWRSG